ncbi:hypothetical protein A9K66_24465 [Mesorhizobium sp. AA23]|nr:hypothetical protein A9K66_24465 [Mesorhizobium sp. AA23]
MKLLAQRVEAIGTQLFKTLAAQPQPAYLRRHLAFPLPVMVIGASVGECATTLSEAEREQLLEFPADRDELDRLTL